MFPVKTCRPSGAFANWTVSVKRISNILIVRYRPTKRFESNRSFVTKTDAWKTWTLSKSGGKRLNSTFDDPYAAINGEWQKTRRPRSIERCYSARRRPIAEHQRSLTRKSDGTNVWNVARPTSNSYNRSFFRSSRFAENESFENRTTQSYSRQTRTVMR